MFSGEYHCCVDGAGLFVLPTPVRTVFLSSEEEATRSVVLLKSLEGCLWMYRTQDWEAKLSALRQQLDDQQSRLLMHYLVAQSMPSSVDTTGRLAIPPPLLEYAKINREVVIDWTGTIGLSYGSRMQWDDYLLRLEDQHTLVLEKIVSLL